MHTEGNCVLDNRPIRSTAIDGCVLYQKRAAQTWDRLHYTNYTTHATRDVTLCSEQWRIIDPRMARCTECSNTCLQPSRSSTRYDTKHGPPSLARLLQGDDVVSRPTPAGRRPRPSDDAYTCCIGLHCQCSYDVSRV